MPLFPTAASTGVLPASFTHWHDESFVEAGGQITFNTNTQLAYAIEVFQNPATLNDSFSFYKLLAAGNYNLSLLTVLTSNVGILQLEIDGNLAFNDMDLYSSSLVVNGVLQKTITIPSDGLHKFKFTIIGKNPASSSYYFSGRKIWGRKL